MSFNIIPANLAVKAMRDSGYKNAAYAIAELVDNSVQAGADLVEIMVREDEEFVRQRTRSRVKQIAVLDNGSGMVSDALRRALQFGNGERLSDRSGIGRFGMGLPNASLSQAKRVEVWTWQDGLNSALYAYLDVDEISSGKQFDVPEPVQREIPATWMRQTSAKPIAQSGTLVVWSHLDRCDWRTAQAIFKNSEFTIGRIYRRFIADGRAKIRMVAFLGNERTPKFDEYVRPNDPMYLMPDTSCPDPWSQEPMFEQSGSVRTWQQRVFLDGRYVEGEVRMRVSVARASARSGDNAGATKHGKHAGENIGVSIVRADRELELQREWSIGYDPRERWWGCEVEFDPCLDEVFGVTNNKQHARTLAEFALAEAGDIARREGFESAGELEEEWTEDGDPRLILWKLKTAIENDLAMLRKSIKAHGERQKRRASRHDVESAESRGTRAIDERKKEGQRGISDEGERFSVESRTEAIRSDLESRGLTPEEAAMRAQAVVMENRKFEFVPANIDTAEFFTVRPRGGVIIIELNTNHPAYESLVAVLEGVGGAGDTIEEVRGRLQKAYEGLKLLFEAWARYEDELTASQRERAKETRYDWGRVAKQFFSVP